MKELKATSAKVITTFISQKWQHNRRSFRSLIAQHRIFNIFAICSNVVVTTLLNLICPL
uniref:Uncharacterized protein n=1 Tax=Romanomermis culicivorax TaxID=13658 RepID=A0A915LEG0_ROMCU